MARRRTAEIDLLGVVNLLHEHLTAPLCHAAFKRVRRSERQRVWTLNALVRFWTAVVLRAPTALSQALADSLEGREPMFPRIQATPEAFFQRCRDLRPAFFVEVFERFTARLVDAVPPRYAADLAPLYARFPAVVLLDGSRLAASARRLKLLWGERAVVLPGALLGVYDLGRGLCRALHFDPDAAASEFARARTVVATLPRHALVVGDRLYATAAFFALLHAHQCWAVVRRHRALGLHKRERLRKRRFLGGALEDWLARAGAGTTAPAQTLRHIRWRRGGLRYEVLTNVLSPTQLAAEEALALYPFRWSIERMFFDLKEVLNLNRLYAANPNAVAMQVYPAAIVYNAFRIAQSDAAAQLGEPPRGSLAGEAVPEDRRGELPLSACAGVGAAVATSSRGPASPPRHPLAGTPLDAHHGRDHSRRAPQRAQAATTLLRSTTALEIAPARSWRSTILGEVILAAMRLIHGGAPGSVTLRPLTEPDSAVR